MTFRVSFKEKKFFFLKIFYPARGIEMQYHKNSPNNVGSIKEITHIFRRTCTNNLSNFMPNDEREREEGVILAFMIS